MLNAASALQRICVLNIAGNVEAITPINGSRIIPASADRQNQPQHITVNQNECRNCRSKKQRNASQNNERSTTKTVTNSRSIGCTNSIPTMMAINQHTVIFRVPQVRDR